MKKTIVYFAIAIAGLSFASCGGNAENKTKADVAEAEVPMPVKDAFMAKYPGAADVKWEKETEEAKVIYEAEFKMETKEMEALFEENGTFVSEKMD